MGFHLVACLHHRVGHALQDGCVAAGVHCGHGEVLDEGEFLDSEGLVQILPLDVFTDGIVADRVAVVFDGAEVHPGSMVVLVIDDVHIVVPEIILILFLELGLPSLEDDDLVLALFHEFLFDFGGGFFLEVGVESSSAEVFLEEQVLLVLGEILGVVLGVEGGLPLPGLANFDKVVTGQFKLVGGEFSSLLEDVLFWRGAQFLTNFLREVVGDVLGHVPIVHSETIITYNRKLCGNNYDQIAGFPLQGGHRG